MLVWCYLWLVALSLAWGLDGRLVFTWAAVAAGAMFLGMACVGYFAGPAVGEVEAWEDDDRWEMGPA